jgi:hypothetical protein
MVAVGVALRVGVAVALPPPRMITTPSVTLSNISCPLKVALLLRGEIE